MKKKKLLKKLKAATKESRSAVLQLFTSQISLVYDEFNRAAAEQGADLNAEDSTTLMPVTENLYRSDLRTRFFVLEGLCRVMRKVHSARAFEKLLTRFKAVEDSLGQVDYWDNLADWCRENAAPAELTAWFDKRYKDSLVSLNSLLLKDGWLKFRKPAKDGSARKRKLSSTRLKKITRKLAGLKWQSAGKERRAVLKFLARNLEKCSTEYTSGELDINELEDGIHEYRRNVRWFSIYCHALRGLVALDEKKMPPALGDFYSDDVVSSPFNRLPDDDLFTMPARISAGLFYAYSWLVGRLGDLKDKGQLQEALLHGLIESSRSKPEPLNEESARAVIVSLGLPLLEHHEISRPARDAADLVVKKHRVLKSISREISARL